MRFLLFLVSISLAFPSLAQNNELLRSRGTLPKNIAGTNAQQIRYETGKRQKPNEILPADQLTLINRTVSLCESIVLSGRLMVNDTMSSYANSILDILLKDDPALRKQLCVYFYYSKGTNAVTLYNGMIIIEMGLMAHVKNEAQLAFILSHEICHYREDHFLKYYRYSREKENANDPLATVLSYSREQEQEADSLGFIIYKKSGYAISEAITTFDMLLFSDIAEEQMRFSPFLFEQDEYEFPLDYLQDTLDDVFKEIVNETLSTHPSCESRKAKMKAFAGSSGNGERFLVSQSVFNSLRRIAREECCSLFLENREYGEAIYRAYVLLIEDKTNVTARKVIGKAFYNLAAYSLPSQPVIIPDVFIADYDPEHDFEFESHDNFTPLVDYQGVEGESQRMHYFLFNVNRAEFAMLAMKWNWEIYRQGNYNDELWAKMCNGLFRVLTAYYDLGTADFSEPAFEKRSTLKKGEEECREYSYHAFDAMKSDSLFKARFARYEGSKILPTETPLATLNEYNQQRESDYGLNIHNMYLLPSRYIRVTEIKETSDYVYDVAESEELEKQQQLAMASSGKTVQKGFFMLSPQTMDSTKVNDYNTYCMLQQWMSEQNAHSNALALNLAHAELADSLIKNLGTRYVMTSSIVSKKKKSAPRNKSQLITYVYDLKTGKMVLFYEDIIKTNASFEAMSAYYTKVFRKISKKAK